jgi:hypothetical protein
MGGLVARSFMRQFPASWEAMNGRLIMLGAPNHGSFDAAQLLSGYSTVLKIISLLDLKHGVDGILRTAATFASIFQMLPDKRLLTEPELSLWDPATYPLPPGDEYFRCAAQFWDDLAPAADPDRMICVLGANRATAVGVRDTAGLAGPDGYEFSMAGDGTVPHRLSLLHAPDGRRVPVYYADIEHSALPGDGLICEGVDEMLQGRGAGRLRTDPQVKELENPALLRAAVSSNLQRWEEAAAAAAAELHARGDLTEPEIESIPFTESERQAEELLLHSDSSL